MSRIAIVLLSVLSLAACASQPEARFGADGKPLPQVYKIKSSDEAKIPYRVLDSLNALRSARGVAPVTLSAELTAAAATHSRDMSVQNRAWHFGSDGSSPIDRARRAGYMGQVLGEDISETFETESETLSAWMNVPDTREVLLSPEARQIGIAWLQEPTGKIWWTLLTGS
jgi:uncharacterized protein YkwD